MMPGSRSVVRSVHRHPVPAWWRDAKLGIFVHWTPASVPAFAPTGEEIGELLAAGRSDAFAYSPYAEWYENSLRFANSPVARYHREHFGTRPYRSFARDWESALEHWDPHAWAARFAATGARYVVLVTKHHDGYCLWPSEVANPRVTGLRSSRDVVGELAAAVRAEGLRFGVYYSGGLDWTFNDHPIGTVTDLAIAQPRGEYIAYATAQVRELIERYAPSVLWNDISWPAPVNDLARLLADYYDAVPDGVVNDRFLPWSPLWQATQTRTVRRAIDRVVAKRARQGRGIVPPKPPLFDVRTPEYAVFDAIQRTPWECVRGMDKSFGHNRASSQSDFLTRRDLLWTVADITSKNGNLLLNVGPRGEDAQIAAAQLERLDWLRDFVATASEALHGTRPWVVPGSTTADGAEVRYTARDRDVFAFIRPTRSDGDVGSVTLPEVGLSPTTQVDRLDGNPITAVRSGIGLRLGIDPPAPSDVPVVVRLRDVTAARR
jgi:alpha-L-fucosidase